jgi:uncharacterized protein (DUF2267 family)
MSDLSPQDAERAARAVLVTLREAVSEKELRDMFSQRPEDMRRSSHHWRHEQVIPG